jgi:hypothetical protein
VTHHATIYHAPAEFDFNFWPASVREVQAALTTVCFTDATGSENISNRMLKLSCKGISSIFTKIFNMSLAAGQSFSVWKNAIVTPVFKKGCKYNMNNYRSIAVLPVLSHVFERLLAA